MNIYHVKLKHMRGGDEFYIIIDKVMEGMDIIKYSKSIFGLSKEELHEIIFKQLGARDIPLYSSMGIAAFMSKETADIAVEYLQNIHNGFVMTQKMIGLNVNDIRETKTTA